MPLNPQIILSGVAPTIKSAGEARMEAIRQQQALMQQQTEQMTLAAKQREVADAEEIRQALKETNGDLEAALPKIRAVSPTAAMAFEKDLQAQKKSKADTSKAELETQMEHVKLISQILQGANQKNYPLIRKMVTSAVGTEDGLPAEFDQDAINSLISTGQSASEHLSALRDAEEKKVKDAQLPGIVADSTIKQNVAANMAGGLTADQQADNANQALTREQEAKRIALEGKRVELEGQRVNIDRQKAAAESAPVTEIKPNTPEFRIAQDLAYGKMTFAQFRTLTAYNRNIGQKFAIYDKAAQLNPDFNPASFEIGLTLAKNPKVQQQLASLDNVVSGVPDLLAASEAAKRSGATVINKYTTPIKIALGDKNFTNFNAARIAFADELSGALGYGSATDMSREMGFNMTDSNLSPENFSSAIQNIIVPFVARKRASILKQEGIYGQPGGSAGAGPKVGDTKTFPNGRKGKWDGKGWVAQ